MSVLKLVPTAPAVDGSPGDRVLSALSEATKSVQEDIENNEPPSAVMVILWHHLPNGMAGESWYVQGLYHLEAVGLLTTTIQDITRVGLSGNTVDTGDDAS